jgi:hypothetical protein
LAAAAESPTRVDGRAFPAEERLPVAPPAPRVVAPWLRLPCRELLDECAAGVVVAGAEMGVAVGVAVDEVVETGGGVGGGVEEPFFT